MYNLVLAIVDGRLCCIDANNLGPQCSYCRAVVLMQQRQTSEGSHADILLDDIDIICNGIM